MLRLRYCFDGVINSVVFADSLVLVVLIVCLVVIALVLSSCLGCCFVVVVVGSKFVYASGWWLFVISVFVGF